MNTKKCFKCQQEKPISEFYKHPRTSDRHLNKCKSCTKSDVKSNYDSHREKYSLYEKLRNSLPERKAYARKREKLYAKRNPQKYSARNILHAAVRDGKLKNFPAEYAETLSLRHTIMITASPLTLIGCASNIIGKLRIHK